MGRPRDSLNQPFLDRFWKYVEVGKARECWPWIGGRSGVGYGLFMPRSSTRRGWKVGAHVVAYELQTATEVPDGMQIDHTCHNRACMNVRHMVLLTASEHGRRHAQQRWAKG